MTFDYVEFLDIRNDNTSFPRDEVTRYRNINRLFLTVAPIVLLLVGLPGNVMTGFVLCRRNMRDKMFTPFLLSLCLVNITTLSLSMSRFLSVAFIGQDILYFNPILCRLFRWSIYSLFTISSWHLVIITGFRLFYIIFRIKSWPIYTCLHPTITIFLLCFGSALAEYFIIDSAMVYRDEHGYTIKCYLTRGSVAVYIHFIIYCIVPAFLLTVFNTALVVLHFKKDSGLVDSLSSNKIRQQLLILVITSGFQFIITSVPVGLFYIYLHKAFNWKTRLGQQKGSLAINVTAMLFYTNNATNFIVYCFFGQKFRRELFKLFKPTDPERPSLIFPDIFLFSDKVRSQSVRKISRMSNRNRKSVVQDGQLEPGRNFCNTKQDNSLPRRDSLIQRLRGAMNGSNRRESFSQKTNRGLSGGSNQLGDEPDLYERFGILKTLTDRDMLTSSFNLMEPVNAAKRTTAGQLSVIEEKGQGGTPKKTRKSRSGGSAGTSKSGTPPTISRLSSLEISRYDV